MILPGAIHLECTNVDGFDDALTGNWAQRSFFITAIAKVTAGLRWPGWFGVIFPNKGQ